MLAIPDDFSGANGEQFLKSHPESLAARAAYESAKIGRSTNSVSLLLMGLSGAGKSSVANKIFDAPICKVGDSESTTKVIEELTVPMPSENLKASNTKVIVFDTPGFGDTTDGTIFDAQTLLAVEDTFRNRYIPNFVLLVADITGKRFDGPKSQFVKMLQMMKSSLVGTVIDDKRCNVVLVLTHFMGQPPDEQEKEQTEIKVERYKKLVRQYLGLEDVYACVAENNSRYNLPKEGDFSRLPCGDLYPGNVLQQLVLCAGRNHDVMGQALICEAILKGSRFPTPQERSIEIMETPEADQLAAEIENLSRGKASSELRRLLREKYPKSVDAETLGLELDRCGIRDVSDFPQSTEGLMKLMKKLNLTATGQEILKTLGVQVPQLSIDLHLGRGYNVSKDQETNTSSSVLSAAKLSAIGCLLPGNVQAFDESAANIFCKKVTSQEEYIESRLIDLKVSGPISSGSGSLDFKHGYNLSRSGSLESMTAVYERVIYKLRLSSTQLGEDFKRSVQNLPTRFDQQDEANIDAWRSFFDRFGTHYVQEVKLGGCIQFTFTGKAAREVDSKTTGGSLNVQSLFASLSFSASESRESSRSFASSDAKLTVRGGRSELLMNAKSPQEIEAKLPEWEQSLHEEPVVIDRVMGLAENASLVEGFKPEVSPPFREALRYLYKNELKVMEERVPTTREEIVVPVALDFLAFVLFPPYTLMRVIEAVEKINKAKKIKADGR